MTRSFLWVLAGFSLSILTACGGGGGDGDGGTATGIFKDSNVGGLGYSSGGIESVTSDGEFTYEVGSQVTFRVGSVVLGSTGGKSVITPVDLVANGSSSSTEVLNIVRFLMMLDTDNDPDERIDISFEVSQAAENWDIDFTSPSFDADMTGIVAEASDVDPLPHTLPTVNAARTHLESTMRCVRAGGYRGTYSGDDTGPFGVLVDASNGLLSGYAWSNGDQQLLTLSGTTAVSLDQSGDFLTGDTSSGATFEGSFPDPDTISGTWDNSFFATSGTFSGERIGGAQDSLYRFTGSFNGDAFGLFTFDVDAQNNVEGIAYTVFASADGTTDETADFTGTLAGTSLSAEISDGGIVDAVISGTLNTSTGTTGGTWSDGDGNGGSFTGTGCRLN